MNPTDTQMKKIKFFSNLARFSCVLEVCSEKPGNVSPSHDFHDTSFENFIFGSVFLGDAVESAALSGFYGCNAITKSLIGRNIYDAVKTLKVFNERNTHLGIIMLFVPLSVSFGVCVREDEFDLKFFRRCLRNVLESSTVEDSLYLRDAFMLALPGGLGKEELDIMDENFKYSVLKNNITFYDLMKISSGKDLIASELANGMEITFNFGLPEFLSSYGKENFRNSVLKTYLALLSKFPDTLIARKRGLNVSKEVSKRAFNVICGKEDLSKFRNFLYENHLNPGTMADITAASVFIGFLIKFGLINAQEKI